MDIAPVIGTPIRFPPGRVAIRLGSEHKLAYKRLYGQYQTVVGGIPVLRDGDFDGRAVKLTPLELRALNRGFESLNEHTGPAAQGVFSAQERTRNRLFKKLQHLS